MGKHANDDQSDPDLERGNGDRDSQSDASQPPRKVGKRKHRKKHKKHEKDDKSEEASLLGMPYWAVAVLAVAVLACIIGGVWYCKCRKKHDSSENQQQAPPVTGAAVSDGQVTEKAAAAENRLRSLLTGDEQKLALVVFTGSCSPTHKAHVQNVIRGMQTCQNDYKVIAGILVPSSDHWVNRKWEGRDCWRDLTGSKSEKMEDPRIAGNEYFGLKTTVPVKHRWELAKIAVSDARTENEDFENLIFAGKYEIDMWEQHNKERDYFHVTKYYRDFYKARLRAIGRGDLAQKLTAFYVCGFDHGLSQFSTLRKFKDDFKTLILERDDPEQEKIEKMNKLVNAASKWAKLIDHAPEVKEALKSASSTKFRKYLRKYHAAEEQGKPQWKAKLLELASKAQVNYAIANAEAIVNAISQKHNDAPQ